MLNIQFLNLPGRVKAVSTKNEDDSYTVVINSRLNHEQQIEGYKHEIHHIVNEDHEKYDINSIEVQAHKNSGNILDQSKVENRKQELRARRWAYERLVGIIDIVNAYKNGVKNRHELAEYLNVTEEFIEEVILHYRWKYGLYFKIDNYVVYFEPLSVLEMWE